MFSWSIIQLLNPKVGGVPYCTSLIYLWAFSFRKVEEDMAEDILEADQTEGNIDGAHAIYFRKAIDTTLQKGMSGIR